MLSKIWLAVIGAGMATTLTIVSACSGAPRAVDPAQASVSRRTESRVVALPPPPVSAARGARPFDWGELRVWLPPAWTPPDYSQTCRSVGFRDLASRYGEPGAVGVELATCKYPRAHGDALSITRRLAAPPAGGHGATINGIPVVEYGRDGIKNAVVDVPSLHAQLTAKTSSAARIVTTLQPSASYDLLHTPGRLALPRSWRQITWHGITLDVPRSWYLDPVATGRAHPSSATNTHRRW